MKNKRLMGIGLIAAAQSLGQRSIQLQRQDNKAATAMKGQRNLGSCSWSATLRLIWSTKEFKMVWLKKVMTKTKWTLISSMQKATKQGCNHECNQLVDKDNKSWLGLKPICSRFGQCNQRQTNCHGAITDPVGANLVKDLQKKPGGNITGVSDHNPTEQQLKLIRELTRTWKQSGSPTQPKWNNSKSQVEEFTKLAEKAGYKVVPYSVPSTKEIASTVSVMSGKVDAIWVPIDNTIASAFSAVVEANKDAKNQSSQVRQPW